MSENNDIFYCPYIYGFSNYSRNGFKKNVLFFSNVMDLEGNGPIGTQLGGTGIAVSNASPFKKEAFQYALWVASAECQKDIYYKNGGQPGNAIAWEDKIINEEVDIIVCDASFISLKKASLRVLSRVAFFYYVYNINYLDPT